LRQSFEPNVWNGSTAVHPYPVGNRQQWVVSCPSPRRIEVDGLGRYRPFTRPSVNFAVCKQTSVFQASAQSTDSFDAYLRTGARFTVARDRAKGRSSVPQPGRIRGMSSVKRIQKVIARVRASFTKLGAPAQAVPALIAALGDANENVRANAAKALARIGPAAVEAVPTLIAALGDANENVRANAAKALARIGPAAVEAVPALIAALGDANENVRANAAEALEQIGFSVRRDTLESRIDALTQEVYKSQADAEAARAASLAHRPAQGTEFEAPAPKFKLREMLAKLRTVRLATPPRPAGVPQAPQLGEMDEDYGSTGRSGAPGVTVGIFQKHTGIDPVVGWLVCVRGTNKGRDYRLHSDLNKLGRAPNMDVCIEGDEAISRENHCQIAFSPRSKTFSVVPGDGRNISYLNNEDVLSAMRLKAYDRLDLGDSSFIFIPFDFDWETTTKRQAAGKEADPEIEQPEEGSPEQRCPRRNEPPPPIRPVPTDAEALAPIGPAAVEAIRQYSAEAAGTIRAVTPDAEPVDAAVFAPRQVVRDSVFLIQVFLYPPGADEKVDYQTAARHLRVGQQSARDLRSRPAPVVSRAPARKMDAIAERCGTYLLPFDLPRNTRVDLHLEVPNLIVIESDAVLIWRGRPTAAQFEVTAPATAPSTEAIGRIRFAVAGVPAGTLRFKITLVATGSAVERGALREVEAVRYRRAFVSYSMQDRAEVLRRVQAFRIAGLNVFQDILDLQPGERWARELYREIDECDVFLLFWSRAAAASQWVAKEIAYALARKAGNEDQPPAIQPVPIEGPPPPETLRHLHFNDALLAHIQAATPGQIYPQTPHLT